MELLVIKPGTPIEFESGGIAGVVLQVCIQAPNRVSYQVAWWEGCSRCSEWVEAFEIKARTEMEVHAVIGFRPGNEQWSGNE